VTVVEEGRCLRPLLGWLCAPQVPNSHPLSGDEIPLDGNAARAARRAGSRGPERKPSFRIFPVRH